MRLAIIIIIGFFPVWLWSQTKVHITGTVTDNNNQPLPGCHVISGAMNTITDANGIFSLGDLASSETSISFSFLGFQTLDTIVTVGKTNQIRIQLKPENHQLTEVSINGVNGSQMGGLTRDKMTANELRESMNGTLTKTLERLPGFNSMDIGASASKPVIRGMAFNRVVVVNNGIKQEGQQWGADHGLEIDPFLTERAEVIKGAVSLEHGSEAMGGLLQITSNTMPESGFSGNFQVLGKTVNETLGSSLLMQGSNQKLFFKTRFTVLDFGDYRIPADTIIYLSRKIPVFNRRLKNTAGKEQDVYLQAGMVQTKWQTSVSASRVWQKSGFFPGAHGKPDLQRVAHDGSFRDIDFPFQNMEHLKLVSNTRIQAGESFLAIDLGYQRNHRQEWSLFHTHFGEMAPPEKNPNLEMDFTLNTWTGNGRWTIPTGKSHSLTTGVQIQKQENHSSGFGFFLPDFNRQTYGLFVKSQWQINPKTGITSGLRYDHGNIETEPFFDQNIYNYMIANGTPESEATAYAQRAVQVKRQYANVSWLASLKFEPRQNITFTINTGSSFRIPTAIELSANGIHHGSFRHETGSANLSSEKGYFVDGSFEIRKGNSSIMVTPYLYYFSNYIFLSPSLEWSALPHAGQIYRYMQSEAMMGGVEFTSNIAMGNRMNLLFNGEWLINAQTGDDENSGYPLPFSPPANFFAELSYKLQPNNEGAKISIHGKSALKQSRIARNESITPGYFSFGMGFHTSLKAGSTKLLIDVHAHNIFNNKYFNHISFYRKLEIPEPGRNVQILLSLPF